MYGFFLAILFSSYRGALGVDFAGADPATAVNFARVGPRLI
jgi:hypothetical protein